MNIQNLVHELAVLSKAIEHKNLSAAAVHIGLSQPQLSRLISKLEQDLNVVLLDRSARRKSGWTDLAKELAISYRKQIHRLEDEIFTIAQNRETTELKIGTLEGLSHLAIQFAKMAYDKLNIQTIYLDILDFKDLDSDFIEGSLDLIFTVRSPSAKKNNHMIEVGYQQTEEVSSNPDYLVISPFELNKLPTKNLVSSQKRLISNSLSVRTHWFSEYGGIGNIPVDAKKGKGKGHYTVYLIGQDIMSPKLWQSIEKLF